jgi:hypothetical protein
VPPRWALPGAVVLGAVVVAAAVWFSSQSVTTQLAALEREIGAIRSVDRADAPIRVPVRVPAEQTSRLSQSEFDEAWEGSASQRRAEDACWRPADDEGRPTDPSPRFRLQVGADGRITRVSYDPRAEELFPGIYPCVESSLLSLRLPPGQQRAGEVQANRRPPG